MVKQFLVKDLCKTKVPLIAVRFLLGGRGQWVTRVSTSSNDVTLAHVNLRSTD